MLKNTCCCLKDAMHFSKFMAVKILQIKSCKYKQFIMAVDILPDPAIIKC